MIARPELADVPEPTDLRRAAIAAAAALLLAGVVALAVAIGFASDLRSELKLGFAGVPRTPGEALAIFVNNGRLMLAVCAAAFATHSLRLGSPDGELGAVGRLLRGLCDTIVAAAAIANVALVGASIGAYGGRMIVGLLPHGPVELAAFALALALYLRARDERLALRPAARLVGWAVALLALAALLETFVHP